MKWKRSNILYGILLVMVAALFVTGFTVPQEVLDKIEMFLLLIVLPIMGWLWIQAYMDFTKGK